MNNNFYPKIKHAVLLCLLFIGIQIIVAVIFEVAVLLSGIGSDSIIYGIGTIFIYILSFGVIILIGFKKSGKKFNEIFLFNNVPLGIWIPVIIFMFGFLIISSEIDNFITYILPMPAFLEEIFFSMLADDYLVISILLVGILPAIFEEMFFRGVLISGFRQNYSQTKTILVSALLFGVIHLNPYQFVTAFLIGIIMAYALLKTNSILPAIYMHFFNNMAAVIFSRFNFGFTINGFNAAYGEHYFQPVWFNLTGIALAAAGAYLFIVNIRKIKSADRNETANQET